MYQGASEPEGVSVAPQQGPCVDASSADGAGRAGGKADERVASQESATADLALPPVPVSPAATDSEPNSPGYTRMPTDGNTTYTESEA